MARTLSARPSDMIRTSCKNKPHAQTKASFPEVLKRADGQAQGMSKFAQVPRRTVPEHPNAVDQKPNATKATVPKLQAAACKHTKKEPLTSNAPEVPRGNGRHIRKNRGAFALQVVGIAITAGALLTIPILDFAGSAATGPVIKSLAAVWQSTLGSLPANSLLASCQSAAMGSTALGNIVVVGAAGAAIAVAATISRIPRVRKKVAALFRRDVTRPR